MSARGAELAKSRTASSWFSAGRVFWVGSQSQSQCDEQAHRWWSTLPGWLPLAALPTSSRLAHKREKPRHSSNLQPPTGNELAIKVTAHDVQLGAPCPSPSPSPARLPEQCRCAASRERGHSRCCSLLDVCCTGCIWTTP